MEVERRLKMAVKVRLDAERRLRKEMLEVMMTSCQQTTKMIILIFLQGLMSIRDVCHMRLI